jgi:raffinose/stachyose/melibiose transport system permease protein
MEMKKNRRPIRPGEVVKYILFTLLALIYILPLVWVLNVSVKTNAQLFRRSFRTVCSTAVGQLLCRVLYGGPGRSIEKFIYRLHTVTLVVSMIVGAMAGFRYCEAPLEGFRDRACCTI